MKQLLNSLRGRKHVPTGEAFEKEAARWIALASDEGAIYDKTVEISADEIEPFVTWGTNPSMGSGVSRTVPYTTDLHRNSDQQAHEKALAYMGLEEGMPLTDIEIQHVFIGSCTNARLSDLRTAAKVIEGKKVHLM